MTEDGSVHHIEIAKEPNVSVSLSLAPSGHLHLPYKVTCLDFHQDLSLITAVCGSFSVSSEDYSGMFYQIFHTEFVGEFSVINIETFTMSLYNVGKFWSCHTLFFFSFSFLIIF